MGFNVSKRVSNLRKQVDRTKAGRWNLLPVTLVSFILISLFTFVLLPKYPAPIVDEEVELSAEARHELWKSELTTQFSERLKWLQESWLVLMPGAADRYYSFGRSVVDSFDSTRPPANQGEEVIELSSIGAWFNRAMANVSLRAGFVIIAFWPLWFFATVMGIASVYYRQRRNRQAVHKDLLTVLERGNGPFYSGIFGKFKLNNSFSGTDVSCPSLACPKMEKRATAASHPLAGRLKKFGALNETNITLLRIILAHKHFPSTVGEEIPVQPEDQEQTPTDPEDRKSETGYIVVDPDHTLLKSTIAGLNDVLEAHRRIAHYRQTLEKKNIRVSALNKNYPAHAANIEKLAANLSPSAAELVRVLTPNRIWAFGQVSPKLIASAYLAIEAGKCLVFEQHGEGFTRKSNYPQLQARAIIQSIPAYHDEYNGDARLIIRQAIICSRRHGDFGRAFLPNRMPVESRALRDWLEILYSAPEQRQTARELVELDAHIEEIGINWRLGFANCVRGEAAEPTGNSVRKKGIPFKSVLLMPLSEVVDIALKGIHPVRKQRIADLLPMTSKYQAHLSISARLPGFKRQAMEAERSGEDSDKIIQHISSRKNGEQLIEHWRIVRRMLTRYNWLSTRVGDDGVPLAGLVQGIIDPSADESQSAKPAEPTKKQAMPALVPLRQRRLSELFGRKWESQYYADAISPETIEVFVHHDEFKDALTAGPEEKEKGELKSVASG